MDHFGLSWSCPRNYLLSKCWSYCRSQALTMKLPNKSGQRTRSCARERVVTVNPPPLLYPSTAGRLQRH
ncbi:hypothetical protein FKM82_025958 [Ascaphus truei]